MSTSYLTHAARTFLPVAVIALLLTPFIEANAETVLRVGDSVTVTADQRVEQDFYAFGGTVVMSGHIAGDMYAMGGSITANGEVTQDIFAVGGTVQVHAPVADDVRVLGGDVVIADEVKGDVFVIGGSLKILSSASVTGDVFFYGGEAEIAGSVGGSVMGTADRFRIDAAVGEDVDVSSSRALVLGSRAQVAGNVSYQSFQELDRAQDAVVEGSVAKTEPQVTSGSGFGFALTFFMIHFFAVLCIYLLFRNSLVPFMHETFHNYARSSVLGLATLFVAPVVVVLLLVTVLGMLLGFFGLFALAALYVLAFILVPVAAGALLAQLVTGRMRVDLLSIMVGVVVVHGLLLIPVLGTIVVFAGFIVVVGSLTWRVYRFVR